MIAIQQLSRCHWERGEAISRPRLEDCFVAKDAPRNDQYLYLRISPSGDASSRNDPGEKRDIVNRVASVMATSEGKSS